MPKIRKGVLIFCGIFALKFVLGVTYAVYTGLQEEIARKEQTIQWYATRLSDYQNPSPLQSIELGQWYISEFQSHLLADGHYESLDLLPAPKIFDHMLELYKLHYRDNDVITERTMDRLCRMQDLHATGFCDERPKTYGQFCEAVRGLLMGSFGYCDWN